MVEVLKPYPDIFTTGPHFVYICYVSVVGLVLETLCALFVVCLLAGLWIFVFKKIIADF